jgi:succinate dehydrogenase / fumarate reductase cytochrome b subunit
MAAALSLYRSSIGKKVIMALTGMFGILFLIMHMIGNLKVFMGEESFNHYAEFLRVVGDPVLPAGTLLWIMRIGLIVAVVLHVTAAVQLTRQDTASRPVGYKKRKDVQATFASRTIRWGGLIIVLFIVYHLLHLTLGSVHPDFIKGNAYHNYIRAFQVLPATLFYVVAMGALGLHLYHGFWSMFQTLGLNNRTYNQLLRGLALLLALVLVIGFLAPALAVQFGFIA